MNSLFQPFQPQKEKEKTKEIRESQDTNIILWNHSNKPVNKIGLRDNQLSKLPREQE
jgi:hypothetical protein